MSLKNEQNKPVARHGYTREDIQRIAKECKIERARVLSAALKQANGKIIKGDPLP